MSAGVALAVADMFEAMTADRPYRAAMPADEALSIVTEQCGTGVCPAAVDGLRAALGAEPHFVATLATTLHPDEGFGSTVRGPARARGI